MLTDDGRRSHWYTNSSPRSLPLRWAKRLFRAKESILLLIRNDFNKFNNTGALV